MDINETPQSNNTPNNSGIQKTTAPQPLKPKKGPKSVIQRIKKIKRLVHYYELLIGYRANYKPTSQYPLVDLVQGIMNDINSGVFVQHDFDEKTYFIANLEYDNKLNLYQGKIYTIRNEDFPMLFNNTTRVTRDIDAGLDDGLAEVSHFLIDCAATYPKVALEYNPQGSRVNNLMRCLNDAGMKYGITEGMERKNIVRDDTKDYIRRMGRFSRLTVKVHKENLGLVNKVAPGLASGLNDAINRYGAEYGQLEIKIDYKKQGTASYALNNLKNTVNDAIQNLIDNPLNIKAFDSFVVDAEDVDDNNRLHAFDLLINRVKSELLVEKREKSRTILSLSMFQLMKDEFIKLKL